MRCFKLLFLLFFTLFITFELVAQEKDDFSEGRTQFVIRKHWYRSQAAADAINNGNTIMAEHQSDVRAAPGINSQMPPPPVFEPFDLKTNIYFTVDPSFYQTYTTIDDFEKDTLTSKTGVGRITRIHRSDLTRSYFDQYYWEFVEDQDAHTPATLKAMETVLVDKSDTQQIAGYNCYRVVMRYKDNTIKLIELYVTEAIDLNYNPIFNYPEELKKFYPLYLKMYLEGNPNDDFEEYKFIKYYYSE